MMLSQTFPLGNFTGQEYDIIATCPHIANKTGFARHMYVKEHPRLVNLPR
jgi:hypothetical protein